MSVEAAALVLNRSPYTAIAMEAGHAYANPEASPLGKLDRIAGRIGVQIGAAINERLIKPVQRWVFLDTYNGEGDVAQKVAAMQPGAIIAEYASLGFEAHTLVLESDPALQQEALDLVAALIAEDPNKRFIHPERKRVMFRPVPGDMTRQYRLCDVVKSGPEKGALVKPNCSTLDTVLSWRKWQGGDGGVLVNVLPSDFGNQQDWTRQILDVAGYSGIPVMSVYFDARAATPLSTISYTANFRS